MGGIGSAVSSLFGGGGNNAGYTADAANITNPLQAGQLTESYDQTKDAMAAQQHLASQLAAQNGLQNQSDVFGQQQQLANALQMQAQGQGPNPAQQALANSTGQNISQQAALMAGQRGAGANSGLIARQAAQTGAGIQQQAVGQGALMQAQQQLAAQQQLGAQQQAMQGVAGNQVANQMAGQGAVGNMALGNQQNVLGSANAFNNALVASKGNQVSANAAMAQTNANNTAGAIGGLFNGGASAVGKMLYKGGRVEIDPHLTGLAAIYHHGYAMGGSVDPGYISTTVSNEPIQNKSQVNLKAPVSSSNKPTGQTTTGGAADASESGPADLMTAYNGGMAQNPKLAAVASQDRFPNNPLYDSHKIPAMLSPGEKYIPPQQAEKVAEGKASLSKVGEKVPGKAEVKGDSLKNDKVPANLDEGGIVIPRSVMESEDPVKEGTKFLVEALQKHGKKGKEENDFKIALKSAIASRGKKK